MSSITDDHFSPVKQEFDEAISYVIGFIYRHFQKTKLGKHKSVEKDTGDDLAVFRTEDTLNAPKPMANTCLRYSMEFNQLKSHNSK